MESHNAGASTLTPSKPKPSKKSKLPETSTTRVPNPTPSKSPPIKSLKSKPIPVNNIRQRKFVVAKKNSKSGTLESVNCKCRANSKLNKCVCVAYESLRASQDEFTKIGSVITEEEQKENLIEKNPNLELGESEVSGERLSGQMKRRRDKVLEVARQSIPSNGCGRVLHLVKAFENALTITKPKTDEEAEDETVKVPKWELPGLRPKAPVTEFSSPDVFLTPESLGLDSRGSCSSVSDHSKPSVSNRNSGGGRRSRRNSSESSATFKGRKGKRTVKTTPQQPFNLKTEQRGKSKQEEFTKKVQEMMIEQEKQRIRIAQGLPWTTDEPESLAKPPVKEITRPVDLVLHSDMRAVERAEFDQQVQEKLSFIEQFKLEKEKQQKLAEEEELTRLRKELEPKAQPMPIFDKPFIPKRSEKQPTMPKQPKIYNPQQKKMHVGP
ncbi:microtubule-destabilizing protein 60-like [Bidens hawaiensis]|uniref:microtubule-destabilizing protein 60-like n=1 Tax=Bidens hawaiensis TaxID=980011 RepID=UPI004049BF5D